MYELLPTKCDRNGEKRVPRLAFSWLSERDVSGGNDTAEIGATKRRQSAAPELILVDVALVACLVHHLCRPFSAAIY